MRHAPAALFALVPLLAAPTIAADPPRDPFAPYAAPIADEHTADVALADVDLGALRLTGVVVGTASPTALVAAPDGRSATLKVGQRVGRSFAIVKAVRRDRIVVETTYRSGIGEVLKQQAVLAIARPLP